MANSKPILGYWGIRGLGQPIRLLVAYLGIEVEDKRYYSMEDWQAEKLTLGLAFPNLPYLIQGDLKLTESRAVIKHFARGSALYPKSDEDSATCDMVENVLWDIWFSLLRYCNLDLPELKAYFENEIPKKLGYLQKYLEKRKFVLGDQLSYVDFLLYEMLYHFNAYNATYLDKYPVLLKYKKNFEEIPEIAKYTASKDYIKAPCINPRAKIAF